MASPGFSGCIQSPWLREMNANTLDRSPWRKAFHLHLFRYKVSRPEAGLYGAQDHWLWMSGPTQPPWIEACLDDCGPWDKTRPQPRQMAGHPPIHRRRSWRSLKFAETAAA